jgi:hypothetical protein
MIPLSWDKIVTAATFLPHLCDPFLLLALSEKNAYQLLDFASPSPLFFPLNFLLVQQGKHFKFYLLGIELE